MQHSKVIRVGSSHRRNVSKQKRTRTINKRHFEPLENRQMLSGTVPSVPPAGSSKLTGTLIGTSGSYQNAGNTIAKAMDGSTGTYFDAPVGVQGWVGLALAQPETITQIQYVPRSGWTSRMVGGVFQGSNTADFSTGVTNLFTVTTNPTAGVYTVMPITSTGSFSYVRYLAPASAFGNVAEVEFDGAVAGPVLPPVTPSAPMNFSATAVSATDVHLSWLEDSSKVTSFTIERQGPSDTSFKIIGTAGASATAYDDLSVAANTTYSYEVIANNSTSASLATAVPTVTTPVAPPNLWNDLDIGSVGYTGSAVVSGSGSITVTGSGADIWNTNDAFNFESQTFTGNGSIMARVTSETNPSSWAKSGIMFRETTASDSRFVLLALTPGYGVTLQARTATHMTPSVCLTTPGKAGVWLELTRNGGTFTGYMSTDGVTWTTVGSVVIPMFNNVQAGFAVTAHNNSAKCTAVFNNITLNQTGVQASAWTSGATTPIARWEASTISYNGLMYVFGGFIDRAMDATSEVDAYNPVTDSWSYVTSIPIGALTHEAATVVGNIAYLAGGNIGSFVGDKNGIATSAVVTYNLDTGIWGSVPSLPSQVTSGGMVAINNHLIYYGGVNAASTADMAGTYSLDLGNLNAGWTTDASLPNARNHLGNAAVNGIAYAIGGQHVYNSTSGNVSEVDAYNPVTNTWSQVASLPIAWSGIHITTIVVNGKIVITGGQTNSPQGAVYLNNIDEFDPVANVWSTVGILPEANQGQSVAYLDNELIVAGGTINSNGGWAQVETLLDSSIQL